MIPLILAYGFLEADTVVAFFLGSTLTIVGGWIVRKLSK